MIRPLYPHPGPPVADLFALVWESARSPAPRLMLNMVTSLDGGTALGGGATPLADDDDRALFAALRAVSDVVLVGAGTVRAENYGPVAFRPDLAAARRSHGLTETPRMAIVSRRLDLDPGHRAFSGEIRPYILTGTDAPQDRRRALADRAEVVTVGERGAEPVMMREFLVDMGHSLILCEGGPELNGQLVAAGLVDEINLTVSPTTVGGTTPRVAHHPEVTTTRFELDRVMVGERMLFLRHVRRAVEGN